MSSANTGTVPSDCSDESDPNTIFATFFGNRHGASSPPPSATVASVVDILLQCLETSGHRDEKTEAVVGYEHLDASLDNLDVILRSFQAEIQTRSANLCKKRNALSKIHRLPVEIFADILTMAIDFDDFLGYKNSIIKDLSSGHPVNRLLYITPEKLMSSEFKALLETIHRQRELSRLVIAEASTAHCISEWGHDFRAEYRKLGHFRDHFRDVPIMALTASATPPVQDDIVANLRMSPDHLFKVVHPFNRANLFYEVRYMTFLSTPEKQYATIHEYIDGLTRRRGEPSCGIIYARTRKTCDELADYLRGKGVQARPYHRGINASRLDATLEDWTEGDRCDLVVATVCFGMGIDKADVRYIIHFDLPKSFEGYYQETGRGGRDGLPSKCIIYYSREDVVRVKKLVKHSHSIRESRNMEPSQRAPNSLDRVCSSLRCPANNIPSTTPEKNPTLLSRAHGLYK